MTGDFIQGIMDAMGQSRRASAANLTVGQLLHRLEGYAEDCPIQVRGASPWLNGKMTSYRGYYEDLALEPSNTDQGHNTVGALRDLLTQGIGQIMHGYKGGEYPITEQTLLWVAAYGETGQMLLDVVEIDGTLHLLCKDDPVWA